MIISKEKVLNKVEPSNGFLFISFHISFWEQKKTLIWWNKILVSVNWLLNELNYFSNYWSIKEENWKRIMYLILFTVVYEYIRKKNWTFVPWYLIVWKSRVRKKNPIILLENWRHVLKAPGKTDGFFQVIFSWDSWLILFYNGHFLWSLLCSRYFL